MKNKNKLSPDLKLVNAVLKPRSTTKLGKLISKMEDTESKSPIMISDLLKEKSISKADAQNLKTIDGLSSMLDGNEKLVSVMFDKMDGKYSNLMDLALKCDQKELCKFFHANQIPDSFLGESKKEKEALLAKRMEQMLFNLEPSASLQKFVKDKRIPIKNKNIESGVLKLLEDNPSFDIKRNSVLEFISDEKVMGAVKDEHRLEIGNTLKKLQRITALAPTIETMGVMLEKNLDSATFNSRMSQKAFVAKFGNELGEEMAKSIHYNSTQVTMRNQHILMNMRDASKDSQVAFIDKSMKSKGKADLPFFKGDASSPLSYEKLFGSANYCECGHCNSVYSPSAYFVELLQYLRNNNLDPENNYTGTLGYVGTPLEHLFWRRPDLKCLQLTCENAFTVLPYIDLSNEIMECYVAHNNNQVVANPPFTLTTDIETFNTHEDDESSVLLAQPQNIHKKAYCVLNQAVYPFTLPYNQPLDSVRTYLDHLDLTRYELMKKFRPAVNAEKMLTGAGVNITPEKITNLEAEENNRVDKALCAEYLTISEEEYVIITKEGCASKEWYEINRDTTLSDEEYHQEIGLKPLHDYYFVSDDTTSVSELKYVEKEFLPRTGLTYVETVDLLKTFYINPYQPLAEVQNILSQINLPYRFLQSLVNEKAKTPQTKYKEVIRVIHQMHQALQLYYTQNPDPCSDTYKQLECLNKCDIEKWVYFYFEKIGKLIVLEGGEAFRFKYAGKLLGAKQNEIGEINELGEILNKEGKVVGKIHLNNRVEWFVRVNRTDTLYLVGNRKSYGKIQIPRNGKEWTFTLVGSKESPLSFELYETCDISRVQLKHLDGSELSDPEWDKIHRFIRLWRKLGWKMSELDSAIIGFNSEPEIFLSKVKIEACLEDERKKTKKDDCGCSKLGLPKYKIGKIDGKLICDLSKILQIHKEANIKLHVLLSFWSDIETTGEKSLYSRLFLRKNVRVIDPVFIENGSGYFLQDDDLKISEHLVGIMAGIKITAADIKLLDANLGLSDKLNLNNLSKIYRHQTFARNLKISVQEFIHAKVLFGNPFTAPTDCIRFLELFKKMESAGLSLKTMAYVFNDIDDESSALKLGLKDQLSIALKIQQSISDINEEHADIASVEFTHDILKSKLLVLFEESRVDEILGFVHGQKNFSTNVPPSLNMTIDLNVTDRITYIDKGAESSVTVRGILSNAEESYYQGLSSNTEWMAALGRIKSQWNLFFEDYFFDLIEDPNDKNVLLSPDTAGSDLTKGYLVLSKFLPKLRSKLEEDSILSALSSKIKLEEDILKEMITSILNDGNTTPRPIIEDFKSIGDIPSGSTPGHFDGKLIPQISDEYVFVVTSFTGSSPGSIYIDQKAITLSALSDPTNVHVSDPVKLTAGTVYDILLSGFDSDFKLLKWKTASKASHNLPDQVLVPKYLSESFGTNFRKLQKVDLILSNYYFDHKDCDYLYSNGIDFSSLDFNNLTIASWERMHDLDRVKKSLKPIDGYGIFDLFRWSKYHIVNPPTNLEIKLIEELVKLTNWDEEEIKSYILMDHFSLIDQSKFTNEICLKKLVQAKELQDKVAVDIEKLFSWAVPNTGFDHLWNISNDLQEAVKARYILEDWEEIVKPINDKIRTNRRDALIDYLLNQKALREWGVRDKDSLFEFFLIDVQMEACMETSRIKQAISSTQLFIQRCFLNLESHKDPNDNEIGVSNVDLDRDRWEWMSRYRIWEANRKVFLYPENWIRTELRDDKSSIYKELESEFLQKDVNSEMVKEALTNYLYKLDEMADMKVVGLHLEHEYINGLGYPIVLHVFSKTRNAPYFFYYRNYDLKSKNWTPWEKIDLDIPTIHNEEDSGSYLVPVVWNKRLLIFFPEFLKKTKAKDQGSKKFETLASEPIDQNVPDTYYEIKMSFSEYQRGTWTQKKISPDPVLKGRGTTTWAFYENISGYDFRTRITNDDVKIDFYHYGASNNYIPYDYFVFDGNQIYIERDQNKWYDHVGKSDTNNFHYSDDIIEYRSNPIYYYDDSNKELNPTGIFKHDFTTDLIKTLSVSNLKTFFNYVNDKRSALKKIDFGSFTNDQNSLIFHELKSAYAIYNWELFFHLPMAIAENLTKNQRFEEAMQWYHFVFDPYKDGIEDDRYWRFLPFRHTNAKNYLESFFTALKDNQSNEAINEWRDNPFNPHLIARSRPTAYMKWTVMKYLDNILEWGDYLFRQDTIESVNYASQLYILAGHILGRRPQIIPKRGKIKPLSYVHIMNKLDAFSMASTELELVFPYSNQSVVPLMYNGTEITLANIYGLSTTEYFCIPNNPKLMSYWDTFSDRLYKIRRCLNIDGVFRKLSLFEPPIDPALLVAATAQGLSLSSVLNDLNGPVPNYRFNYLLQKAFELTNEVKSLGNTLLSLKEKKDGEALSLLRAKHEVVMHNLTMEIKKKQLEESQKSLDSLLENRKSPVYRMQYYLQLIGEDLSKIPSENTDFNELTDKIEEVISEGGLKLINLEKQELDKSNKAANWQIAIGITETLAGILSAIPQIGGEALPFGVGANVRFGGQHLGAAASAVARGMQTYASELSFQSSNAARKAGFTRQLQDRIQQANLAGREIKQIDKQIITQKIRIEMAQRELDNQQQQIDHSKEAEEFLKTKYTNEQLYDWMEGEIKTLFYQSYKLAYDLAKKVEGLYQFEKGLSSSNFIQFGYWNSARDGLLSGEQLYLGLKKIEQAHQENRGHDYEIPNKQISLRKLDPEALLNLRKDGTCEFSIPEELFDLDFPGQLQRRIKTVSFSIPCISGPYTSISAKVNLLQHSFRIDPSLSSGYPRVEGTDDDRFLTMNVPINAVSLSSAQNDGGVFELNFRDERYMPFEGAGIISKWRIELPGKFRQFDYNTISDIIINLAYTSNEGGQKLKEKAEEHIETVLNSSEGYSHYALFDIKHDFAQEWYKAMSATNANGKHELKIDDLKNRLPYVASLGTTTYEGLFKIIKDDQTTVLNSPPNGFELEGNNDFKVEFDNPFNERLWLIFQYKISIQ